jgi:predicted component of type VI protein secretion system
MSSRLVPLNAGVAPTIPLQRPVLLIGRHPECDVRIDLSKISRRHCCIALAYDRVMVRDLGSRNGLRVNGVAVEESQLHPGDEIAIGPIIYRMESEAPAPASAPPPGIPVDRPAPSVKPPSLPDFSNFHDPEGDLVPIDL